MFEVLGSTSTPAYVGPGGTQKGWSLPFTVLSGREQRVVIKTVGYSVCLSQYTFLCLSVSVCLRIGMSVCLFESVLVSILENRGALCSIFLAPAVGWEPYGLPALCSVHSLWYAVGCSGPLGPQHYIMSVLVL